MIDLGFVIQARMNSTRLPGKVLMDFCGKPMLQFQVDLLKRFSFNAKTVVATSENHLDDAVEEFCITENIPFVRGSEKNVFQRFQLVAEKFQFETIIRLTGDNPLTNYQILKTCLDTHNKSHPALTSTREILHDRSIQRYAPKGSSVDIINCQTLLSIDSNALDDFQREHVIPVFFDRRYEVSIVKEFSFLTETYSIDDSSDYQKVKNYAQNLVNRDQLLESVGYYQ